MTTTPFFISFGVWIVMLASGCSGRMADRVKIESGRLAFSGATMGTTYSVKLSQAPTGMTIDELQHEVDEILDKINADMSTYREDSTLSQFSKRVSTDWFPVSSELVRVVREAQRISRLSDGAYDITVAPLVNLWHFGPDVGAATIPSRQAIDDLRQRVGYQRLHVRESPPALRKDHADLSLDLSSIAKGFAVDQVTDFLKDAGIPGTLVEIGGETRTTGTKADGTAWHIGIETPTAGRRGIQRVLSLGNHAIATSGDYRIFFEKDGRRYSHTIDPRTGFPIDHSLTSVSVVTSTCMEADGMATAINVLGPEAGYRLAVDNGLAALLISRTADGFVEQSTPRFQQLFGSTGNSKH